MNRREELNNKYGLEVIVDEMVENEVNDMRYISKLDGPNMINWSAKHEEMAENEAMEEPDWTN